MNWQNFSLKDYRWLGQMGKVLAYTRKREDASSTPGLVEIEQCWGWNALLQLGEAVKKWSVDSCSHGRTTQNEYEGRKDFFWKKSTGSEGGQKN